MTVWPRGCGSTGDIEPQTLTYRVRFENTGAGAAHDIVVRNALDPDLDWNSFQLVRASHPVTGVQIEPDGTLIVRFDGIELPAPDPTQPDANKGFFTYTIDPKPALADGTTITNSAAIYFDNNPPVQTNTTTNTIRTNGAVVPAADFAVVDHGTSYDFVYTGGSSGASLFWSFGPGAVPETSTDPNPTGVVLGSDPIVTLTVSNGSCSSTVAKNVTQLCGSFTAGDFLPPMGKRKKIGRNLPVKFDLLHAGQPVAGQQALDALLLDLGLEPTCPEILVYDVTTGTSVTLPDAPEDASASDDSDIIDNPGLCFVYQNDDGDGGDSDSDSGDTKTEHWQFNLRLDPAIFLPDRTYRVKVRIGSCILEPGNATFQTRQ
ncbi:MAG: hypothetical protein D6776_10495 [Planctomycetota bacterium]|nr:MAG: hypothetical protein D6776_10495 [Planctomycetota bacterium]